MRKRSDNFALAVAGILAVQALGWRGEAQEPPPLPELEIVCPCRIESRGTTATVTAGVRNFGENESGKLALYITSLWEDLFFSEPVPARASLENTVAGGATLRPAGHAFEWQRTGTLGVGAKLGIVLAADKNASDTDGKFILDWDDILDLVVMDTPADVDLSRPFDIANPDLLTDADGDGVSDYNEVLEGTDPGDAASTPGPSTIDVLALYSQGFSSLYDDDPATRVQHVMTVADGIFRGSDTGVRLRLVGLAEAPVEPVEPVEGGGTEAWEMHWEERDILRDAYGADLVIDFIGLSELEVPACGYAGLGGYSARGYMTDEALTSTSTVVGNCGGGTAAHEIGHNLGLGHSFAQEERGTFRWARGHYVDSEEETGTIMSYGWKFTDVFSDPDKDCGGLPCGKDRDAFDGADAAASIQAVRFQVARYRKSATDSDGDGRPDISDEDDDNDGVPDEDDTSPLDPSETTDTDGDGTGDKADADDDNDGVPDADDAFPLDPSETTDSDGDGTGDKADAFPLDPAEATDSDGDGVGDNADLLPHDPSRSDIQASYRFVGENPGDQAGETVAAAGDFDGDGRDDIAIGAPGRVAPGLTAAGAVYLIAAADLRAIDAADGSVDQEILLAHVASAPNSWVLLGEDPYPQEGIGFSLTAADLNGDGRMDLIVGARLWQQDYDAALYLAASANFAAADAADGQTDGIVSLGLTARFPGSWKLVSKRYEKVGASVASIPDLDGDGRPEIAVGAPYRDLGDGDATLRFVGAVHVVASGDLAAADAADGVVDGVVDLENTTALPNSWELLGDPEGTRGEEAGSSLASTGDLDGDGLAELLVGAPYHKEYRGAVYLLSGGKLAAADAADGATDGVIELERTTALSGNWKFVGLEYTRLGLGNSSASDLNGDNAVELILGGGYGTYVLSGADLVSGDAADGATDGVIDLEQASPPAFLWGFGNTAGRAGDVDGDGRDDLLFVGEAGNDYRLRLIHGADLDGLSDSADRWGVLHPFESGVHRGWDFRGGASHFGYYREEGPLSFSPAGDVDGDGLADLLFGNTGSRSQACARQACAGPGEAYLVAAADLAVLDRADGAADRRIRAHNIAGDSDGDGVRNIADPDDDNDGTPDGEDAFPLDPAERADSDRDGVGDNADAFPLNPAETTDSDGDGTGDNADADDDNDGVPDSEDPFPLDPSK